MVLHDPAFAALYRYTRGLSVALGYRDLPTRLHSERVFGLSEEIGMGCALACTDLDALKIAASFHDIGKIGIPDHILKKPARLDDTEREIMKQHAEIGQHILASTELEGAQDAALLIRHHHEHYDGKGYPDGLSGEAIPLGARIISIADSYDAMAVTRTYHQVRTHGEIMAILEHESGSKHDPEIMRVFASVIESSPFKAF